MKSSQHTKIRPNPRISANELAKYLISSDTAKLGIIKRAREVSTAQTIRYKEVKKTLKSAMIDSVNAKKIINDGIFDFEQKATSSTETTWTKDDSAKSVDVLLSFTAMKNQLAGYDYADIPNNQPLMVIEGVEVSVNCDLLITQNDKVGALIYRMTKPDEDETESAKSKRKNMGQYVATLVRMQVDNVLSGNKNPASKLCWSVDVQHGDVHVCPPSVAKRTNDIHSACKFIAAMWDTA